MKLEIQLFAGADVPMLVTKEFNYYQDGVTIKSVKVIVTPDTTGIGYDFENDYNCIVEGWQRVGKNGSLYKVYDKNFTETVKFVYTSKVDSSHMDGEVTIVVNEIKKIYERTVWEDAKIIKPAYVDESGVFHEAQLLGGTLINKDRLNNLEEGIENLYENGATSKDIALSELEVTEDTKILFEDKDFATKEMTSLEFGTEYETGRVINGRKEYGILQLSLGALPASGTKVFDLKLTDVTYTTAPKLYAKSENLTFYIPHLGATQVANIDAYQNSNTISLSVYSDRSSFTLYADVLYTKNQEVQA